MKSDNQKKAGEPQPISLPKRDWEQINIDLVTDLLELEGKTVIISFVEQVKKMTHMVPYIKEVTASQYAWLFMNNIF